VCSRPLRPLGLPIYVARVPAAPFARCFPRSFTFYVADPLSSIREQAAATTRLRLSYGEASSCSLLHRKRLTMNLMESSAREKLREGLGGPQRSIDAFLLLQ
jgi:hypothetical protein